MPAHIQRLDHPSLNLKVSDRLRAQMAEYERQLGAGSAKDWPDYKERTGVIRGLREAIEVCEAVEDELRRS